MEFNVKIHPIYASFAIVLLIGIMYVSLLPKAELPEAPMIQADKLVHFSMYAILAYFNRFSLLNVIFIWIYCRMFAILFYIQ